MFTTIRTITWYDNIESIWYSWAIRRLYGKFKKKNLKQLMFIIVFQGTNIDPRYPYVVLSAMFLIGAICGVYLPETLNQKLPDSLEEASMFGKNQASIQTFCQSYLIR